jgi:hypothetical protein
MNVDIISKAQSLIQTMQVFGPGGVWNTREVFVFGRKDQDEKSDGNGAGINRF